MFKALYESTDLREAINTILKIIGLQFNVSRAYIFEDCLTGWLWIIPLNGVMKA